MKMRQWYKKLYEIKTNGLKKITLNYIKNGKEFFVSHNIIMGLNENLQHAEMNHLIAKKAPHQIKMFTNGVIKMENPSQWRDNYMKLKQIVSHEIKLIT